MRDRAWVVWRRTALALALGASACRAAELTPGQRAALSKRARTAEAWGITVVPTNGEFAFRGAWVMAPGAQAGAPFRAGRLLQRPLPCLDVFLEQHPATALLASGCPHSLIGGRRAERSGACPLVSPPALSGVPASDLWVVRQTPTPGGRIRTYLAVLPVVRIGELRLHKVPMGIPDDRAGRLAWPGLAESDADVLLGYDFVRAFARVTVDFPARHVTWAESGRYRADTNRLAASLGVNSTRPVPTVKALLDGKGPFLLALDTGGEFGLWLPVRVAERLGLPAAPRPGRQVGPRGLVSLGRHTVRVAGAEWREVAAAVTQNARVDEEPPYALLGREVLQNYVVTFDQTARRIYLERP